MAEARGEHAVESARQPLFWKLFGLTALLIVVVIAGAIALTIQRANDVASETVNRSIAGAARLFKDLEQQRLAQLASEAVLVARNDSAFGAYIQSNLSDLVSLNDQIRQRRDSFGTDVVILLDDQGHVISRTDNPSVVQPSGEDLYLSQPLVHKAVDEEVESTRGVMNLGGKLYHAAVAPIAIGATRIRFGYLINANAINEKFADQIAQSTNAGVMFVPSGDGAIARSTNAPAFGMQQMSGVNKIFNQGKPLPPQTSNIDGTSYLITADPLTSAGKTVGAAVFLRSVDREREPFQRIERTLMIGGAVALILSLIVSWLISKRLAKPIEDLAGMAQAVTAGNYDVQPDTERNDEVGILSRAFAQMISSLRDKAELEALYAQMAEKSEEREAAVRPARAPALDQGTILVTDLRGLPQAGEGDAAKVINTLVRVMKLQEEEILRQNGEVREILGHRLISIFRGDRGTVHAIRAARSINEELTESTNSNMTVAAGIAAGEFVTGSVELSKESGGAVVGNAPLTAMVFAWHAPGGFAYIAADAAQTAGKESLGSASKDEVRLKWLPQPMPVVAIPLVSLNAVTMKTVSGEVDTPTMKFTDAGRTAPGEPPEFGAGQLFAGRYRIEQTIGRGGMGVVYKATDTQLDEIVAIKALSVDVMSRSAEDLERFKREIRLARKITHRNVLRTYDYGEADGIYFISMEFVRGYTLAELEDEAPQRQMTPRPAMGIARQICRGLEAAHEQGIIHRDIKPQNVLIDAKGEVKLMDFGIARMTEAKDSMTQAGLIVGTPHYMSPEQVQGKTLDARSDVYSVGILVYEMLVGRRPFESKSLTAVLTAHVTEPPRRIIEVRPSVGQAVDEIVMRCLAKDPRRRYANAGELLADLDRVQIPAAVAA